MTEWIDIKNELPIKYKEVLIRINNGSIKLAYLSSNMFDNSLLYFESLSRWDKETWKCNQVVEWKYNK